MDQKKKKNEEDMKKANEMEVRVRSIIPARNKR